jgi:hypothetical protein
MYRITYWNINTHTEIRDYGFTRWTLDRVMFLIDQNEHFEIAFIEPLVWNWSNFKKCWKNESKIVKRGN